VLPGEADVLANVLADLSDHDAKLVYADWLEERGDKRGPLLRDFVTAYRARKKWPALKPAPPVWRELVGLTLMAQFRGTPLESHTDRLLARARPALACASDEAPEKALAVGASKYGGRPDLPPAAKWPRLRGAPLAFLGQFNLAELHASPVARELPGAGILSVFAAHDEEGGNDDFPKGSWRLFYFPDASQLARREFDSDLPDESRFPSCRLWFTEWLTLPSEDSPWGKGLFAESEAADAYADLFVDRALGDHILGHPFPIQGDILGKKTVRHLLTVGGNDDTGWEWGDGGALYFTLDEKHLRAGKFDRLRMRMDCG
jgi:uncharacterized protein (TIGR02996 family)